MFLIKGNSVHQIHLQYEVFSVLYSQIIFNLIKYLELGIIMRNKKT